jgi:hypothetical protein
MTRHRLSVKKTPEFATALIAAPEARVTPLDAFERLHLAVISLEAIANAANNAIDEYAPPSSADRREFHRVHALVGVMPRSETNRP